MFEAMFSNVNLVVGVAYISAIHQNTLANRRCVLIDTSRFQGDEAWKLQLLTADISTKGYGPVEYINLIQRLWSLKFEMVNGSLKLQLSGVLVEQLFNVDIDNFTKATSFYFLSFCYSNVL